MYNIRSKLTEIIIMLLKNRDINKLTYKSYIEGYKTRAAIFPTHYSQECKEVYDIIVPVPPPELKNDVFIGVKWKNKEYKFISTLKLYKDQFLKSNISVL